MVGKHYIFIFFLVGSYTAFISSCKKNTGPSEPVVTLTSPTDTLVINAGDTVLLEGTVSDNKSLHELYITFRNAANDSILLYEHPYTHGAKSYTFRYIWYTSVSSSYLLTIEAQDHDKNSIRKDFPIPVN